MRNFRVSENAVQSAVATLHADVQRLWTIDAPDLRALHRGRVEGAVDALVTRGYVGRRRHRAARRDRHGDRIRDRLNVVMARVREEPADLVADPHKGARRAISGTDLVGFTAKEMAHGREQALHCQGDRAERRSQIPGERPAPREISGGSLEISRTKNFEYWAHIEVHQDAIIDEALRESAQSEIVDSRIDYAPEHRHLGIVPIPNAQHARHIAVRIRTGRLHGDH